ncbi:hypothetical protein TpMuguga_03g00200 [Theileria parva strain Muguga]|uniref:Serine aminopeptidase S33 domain-containing protein n=1 Tax=Theileria parva TaxID=5875 RepID=Q4N0E4_THEPA|nr:uncharacterized protein TpMuguga_03g00200 [Theileria parva strain Muguga]EAN30935.1 hypothetical protein TpMuguga_03g00200 [Theileria parva strain Muguga]|eukprot:XP_763218.1 hypothetical protein [Theileria parva strain Muguga]
MPLFRRKRKKETEVTVSNTDVRLVDLNIGQLKSPDFTVRKSVLFDFLLLTYSPSRGAVVGKVFLKDTVFWQKGHSQDLAEFVRCYFRQGAIKFVELVVTSNNSTQYLYFYKEYFRWVSTTSHKYAQVFSHQVSNYYVFKSVKLRLTGNVNRSYFFVNRLENAPFYIITPKPAFRVSKVVDCFLTVWDSNKYDSCVNALVFHKNKRPVLAHLQISSSEGLESLYFKKEPLTWNRITRLEFSDAIRNSGFNPDVLGSFLTVKLDLNHVSDKFDVETYGCSYKPSDNLLPTTDNTPDSAAANENLDNSVENSATSKQSVKRTSSGNMSTLVVSKSISPKPGYNVVEITDGNFTVFKTTSGTTNTNVDSSNAVENSDPNKFVVFVNVLTYHNEYKLLGVYFRGSEGTDVMYFTKPFKGKWSQITPEQYYSLFTPDNFTNPFTLSNPSPPADPTTPVSNPSSPSAKMLKPLNPFRLVMGSFVNRSGLRIQTYSSTVVDAKGTIVLVHGAYGHFCSDFATYNKDYFLKYEQFKLLPEVRAVDEVVVPTFDVERQLYDGLSNHSDVFEYRQHDGLALSETGERFILGNSFTEALNALGYSVYGLDLTSHGRSETVNNIRYYVKTFMDYVHDVLQFVEIVKSKTKSSEQPNESKLYLLGYSMGSNIALRAVNYYYQHLNSNSPNNSDGNNSNSGSRVNAKFVDGLICLSGMYEFAAIQNTLLKTLASFVISILAFFVPEKGNPLEDYFDNTICLDAYTRFRDPWYWPKKTRNRMLHLMIRASFDLHKHLSYIPQDLPILMLNSNGDELVTLRGARRINNLLKNSKLVELDGNVHGLPFSQFFTIIMPVISSWLNGSL